MSYSADFFAIWQRAASYVDRGLNLPADAHIAGGRGDRITFRRRLWHTASAGRPPTGSGY